MFWSMFAQSRFKGKEILRNASLFFLLWWPYSTQNSKLNLKLKLNVLEEACVASAYGEIMLKNISKHSKITFLNSKIFSEKECLNCNKKHTDKIPRSKIQYKSELTN